MYVYFISVMKLLFFISAEASGSDENHLGTSKRPINVVESDDTEKVITLDETNMDGINYCNLL